MTDCDGLPLNVGDAVLWHAPVLIGAPVESVIEQVLADNRYVVKIPAEGEPGGPVDASIFAEIAGVKPYLSVIESRGLNRIPDPTRWVVPGEQLTKA